jgi:hypothetical protein
MASYAHVSSVNPRGWFNNPRLNVLGDEGAARFRRAALAYAGQSIANLKRTRAQGMIVWDLEGEQFPQKTSYIGDPRLLARLAPEMEGLADEFFAMFRRAGFSVGLTIRPQQLSLNAAGEARQEEVGDYGRVLLEKIDYARHRWGASLFYIDSNAGPLWPAEVFQIRRIARQRPGVLLIPEHHDFLYYSCCAPYGSMRKGASATTRAIHWLYPNAFQVLNVADSGRSEADFEAAYRGGDVLLFPAWFDSPVTRIIESFSARRDDPAQPPGIRETKPSGN